LKYNCYFIKRAAVKISLISFFEITILKIPHLLVTTGGEKFEHRVIPVPNLAAFG